MRSFKIKRFDWSRALNPRSISELNWEDFFIYGKKGEILRRFTKKNEEIGTQMKEKLIIRMASSLIQNDNAKICSILRGDQKSNFNLKLWGKTRNINRGKRQSCGRF